MRLWWLLLLVPGAGAQALFVAVVPDLSVAAAGDEGFSLAPVDGPVFLAGWSVTDGEGTWRLPDLALDRETWFVGHAPPWAARDGPLPAATFGTTLRLANGGDNLRLLDPAGNEVDAFEYGEELSFAGADLMWRRIHAYEEPDALRDGRATGGPPGTWDLGATGALPGGGAVGGVAWDSTRVSWLDTDSPDDWRTPRIHRVGESSLTMPTFDVDALTAYASPDNTFQVIADLIDGARDRLHLHVYELRSHLLADRLVAAAKRGVEVQVLVTDRPVGQEPHERHETADALYRIEGAGGDAFLAQGGRYRFHHLKVLVADDAVAVQSENWVASGVPTDPSWGNRGWGVVLHDVEATNWFARWMAADRAAWDTVGFQMEIYDPLFELPPVFGTPAGSYHGRVPAATFQGPAIVTPVITPDATHDPRRDPTFAAAGLAESRLWAQQLDLSKGWSNEIGWSGPDGLREALREAGRKGLDARVMAAGPFRLDDTGNQEAMATLPADGVATCTFALRDLVLHNKGLIADDVVYVGSMNGNHHSRSMNREAGVLVEDARVAQYFADLFLGDWQGCSAADAAKVPALGPTLFVVVLVVVANRCSRSSPSLPSSSSARR